MMDLHQAGEVCFKISRKAESYSARGNENSCQRDILFAAPLRFVSVSVLRTPVLGVFLALIMGLSAVRSASAQFGPGLILPQQNQGRDQLFGDPFRRLPRDPLTQASTLKAVQAIEEGEVVTGLQTIQELLDHDSDFFIAEPEQTPRSLFRELEGLIREHRDDYERLFGPTASQLLTEAKAAQSRWRLEEVVRRFSLTNAGAASLQELAWLDRDQGEPALAARELEQLAEHPATKSPRPLLLEAARLLARCGQSSFAIALLKRHPAEFPDVQQIEKFVADSVQQFPSTAESPVFEWRTPYGEIHQTGQTALAPVLFDDAWRSEMIDNEFDFPALLAAPDLAQHLGDENRNLLNAIEQQVRAKPERIAMPAVRPLIVNGLVITSGPGSVKAFHLETGQLAWNGVDLDETFDYLAKQSYSAGEAHDPVREEMRDLFASVRGWRDLTSSSLSSDGQRVYAISNCQLVGTTSQQRIMQNTQRHSLLPQRANRLTAYDLSAEGKKLWSVGTIGDDAPVLNGEEPHEIFFMGAPLPVDGHLYVIGEERGQIQVFELDPATGGVLWSLGLLNPDRDLVLDETRRLGGLMPAYGDGLLFCPSGEGSLTAVDPLKRQVVWTHVYAESMQTLRNQVILMRMMRPQNQNASQAREELLADQRWFDSRIMVAGDAVIFTPPDDDALICLSTSTGKPLWKSPLKRGQMVYAGTIFENQLILIGRNEIVSLRLGDGTPAWTSAIPIPEPSGRGIRMGNQFLQPLVTGEIGVIDLKSGHLLSRFPLQSNEVPGNLIAANGQLVMQTASGLTGFRSRETVESGIAARLKQDPSDPIAIAERGEWRLQQGDVEQGLADLKGIVNLAAPDSSRQVLAWALLDGLRSDFARFRDQAPLIDAGLSTPAQRLQFLRTYARGLQTAGDDELAFANYLKILQTLTWPESLIVMDSQWSATDSSWVLARLDELFSMTNESTQLKLKSQLNDWVLHNTDPALLLRLLPAFPAYWSDPEVILRKLASSDEMETALNEREAILRRLHANPDPAVKLPAAAQLLKLALRGKDLVTAQTLLAELEYHNVALPARSELPPQTSREFAASIRQQMDVADLLSSEFVWPDEIRESNGLGGSGGIGGSGLGGGFGNGQQPPQLRESLYQIPLLGPASLPLVGWTFFMEAGGANIQIFNQYGQRHARIATRYGSARYATESELGRYVCMHNHLVLIVLQDRFLVFDFQSDPASPKLLAIREFNKEEGNLISARNAMVGIPRIGMRSMQLELRNGQMAYNVGPLTGSVLCYGTDTGVVAINPITGAELWRRTDVAAGAEILGDENYVILKPSDGGPARILRARDGGSVKNIPLPAGSLNCIERNYADWGRFIPVVQTTETGFSWSLFDPVRETAHWSYEGPAGTSWCPVSGQKIAFLTPDKKLSIRNGLTGEELFTASVPFEGTARQITVLEFADQWVLFTDTKTPEEIRPAGMPKRTSEFVRSEVDGPAIALDAVTGKVQWTRSVPNQSMLTQGPHDWPLLVGCQFHGNMDSLVLNRRTGAIILSRMAGMGEQGGINWITTKHPTQVQIRFGQTSISLVFGSNPGAKQQTVPSTAPSQSEDPEEPKSKLR